MALALKAFFLALGTALYERVWLSYRSTILGILVTALGETLNYFYLSVPDPRVHAACALLTTIFIAWKDKKVKDGSIKLLAFLLFASFTASAQQPPSVRRAAIVAMSKDSTVMVATEEPAPLPVAEPQFGGCVNAGHLCFGPSVSMTIAAINLKTKTIEGAFQPGLGYGLTLNPGKWSSLGADVYFTLDPAAQKASAAVLLKLFNGYFRVGASKGLIGDTAWRIPLGFGITL